MGRWKDPEYLKKYYQKNKERIAKQNAAYNKARLLGPEGERIRALRQAATKRWRAKNRDKERAYHRAVRIRYKLEMIAAYGGACDCCGETDPAFLTLDHVNRDGNLHRARYGGRNVASPMQIYAELRRKGWPKDGFRVLCMNCNFATRFGDPCPHTVWKPERHAAMLAVV